jgi:hypothetical protein
VLLRVCLEITPEVVAEGVFRGDLGAATNRLRIGGFDDLVVAV